MIAAVRPSLEPSQGLQRSALAAYLTAPSNRTGVLTVLLGLLAAAGLVGVHFWRRRQEA